MLCFEFSEDLWDSLAKASSKPVNQVMSTWTKQMGYPVLTVSAEFKASQCILKMEQKKFTADGSKGRVFSWFCPFWFLTLSFPRVVVNV